VWRALSGVLTGGLVALALAVSVAAVAAHRADVPGPGAGVLAAHVAAATAAVLAQRGVDRGRGIGAVLAGLGVLVLAVVTLLLLWIL